MKKRLMFAVLALLSAVTVIVYGQSTDDFRACSIIKDAKKRLVCFDSAVKNPPDAEQLENAKETKRKNEVLEAKTAKDAKAKEQNIAVAMEAMAALKKLQIRVQTGVSYSEYSGVLSEAKFPVESYLQSPEASEHPKLVKAMSAAIADFDIANMIWKYKFSGGGSLNKWLFKGSPMDVYLVEHYPEIEQARATGFGDPIIVDKALSVIWTSALGHITEAGAAVAKMQ